MPRILIDATQVVVGGGVQVSLALLEQASRDETFEFHAAVSAAVHAQCPDATRRRFVSYRALAPRESARARILEIARSLPAIAAATRPDLVFTVFGPAYWRHDRIHVVGFALPKLIYPIHQYLPDAGPFTKATELWKRRLKARVLRNADAWVAETQTVRRRMETVLGLPADRIAIVRNGYSAAFAQSLEQMPCRSDRGGGAVLVPSAYYPHKDLERIPEIAQALKEAGKEDFRFRLMLPPESEGWRRIEARSRALKVADQVATVGAVPHNRLAEHYSNADIVLLPTLLECSTAVYPEAFLAEVPLVTTDLDFAHELCGAGALYFKPRSAEDAARALLEVRNAPGVRQRLIAGGREALARNYPSPEEKWRAQLECMQRFLE